ncbi:MFS transporter [Herbaspirillum sp. YR522]|uniref:MFS transporter n=1 Tax=Herbaspirillum sp. YR522 TaxID=1144342 RepID=UPI00026F5407|nr:MFS transporter [Herbaspirillum sp. YR522]EJM97491.1 arabinose efflux permease family protein [Herbaspirillum sp. YR522]
MPACLLPLTPLRCVAFCLLVALFELLAYTGSDLVMPAMLQVSDELGADPLHVPLTLALYLLGGVALQWLVGPISDRIGRRPPMLFGCLMFATTSFMLSLAQDIAVFQVLRTLQGCSLAFVIAVGYPALQEAFNQAGALRITALLANIGLLSPLLAPLAGVALLEFIGWRALFMSQAVVAAVVTLGLLRYMPETVGIERTDGSTVPRRALSLTAMISSYRCILRNRHFLACCLAIGLTATPLIGWIALSPQLLMLAQGMDGFGYGVMQVPVFGALIVGNLVLARAAARRDTLGLLRMGTPGLALGALVMLAAASVPADPLLWLVCGMSIYAFGVGIVNSTLYRMAFVAGDAGFGASAAMMGTITVALMSAGVMLANVADAAMSPQRFGIVMALAVGLALIGLRAVHATGSARSREPA